MNIVKSLDTMSNLFLEGLHWFALLSTTLRMPISPSAGLSISF